MSQVETGIRRLLALPAAYDFFQDIVGARGVRLRWIRECLKPFPGARILDIGCGTAELLELLPPDIEYTGFDMSPAYIEAARRRYGNRGRFTCDTVDVFKPDSVGGASGTIQPGGYDIALAFGVLHHLDDAECARVFQGARAALKPDGRMVTMDPAVLPNQTAMARFVISRDRGRNVREPTAYAALGVGSFSSIRVSDWHNALQIPYDHAILERRL